MTDREEIVRALTLWFQPGDVFEIRALGATTGMNNRPHTESGYFDYDHAAVRSGERGRAAFGDLQRIGRRRAAGRDCRRGLGFRRCCLRFRRCRTRGQHQRSQYHN